MINLCCLQVRLLTSGKALNTLKAYSLKMDCQSELKLNRGQQSKGYLGFSRENGARWKDWGFGLVTVIQSPSCSLNAEQLPEPPLQLGIGPAVQENTENAGKWIFGRKSCCWVFPGLLSVALETGGSGDPSHILFKH